MRSAATKGRSRKWLVSWLAGSICVLVLPEVASAQKTFYIDEPGDYATGGCGGATLPTDTEKFRQALVSSGWSGSRYTQGNAWPQDFQDATVVTGGLDHNYADANFLAVFSGHGNVDDLAFSHPNSGQCDVVPSTQMRLGRFNGNTAGFSIYYACCVMNKDHIGTIFPNEVNQQFGFHSTLQNDDSMLADFFNDTYSTVNWLAWLNKMEDRPGWFTGDNSPIVYTFGVSADSAYWKHTNCKLKAEVCLWQSQEPGDYYYWEWRDHGAQGC